MISEYNKLNNPINIAVITVRVVFVIWSSGGGTNLSRARRARSFRGLGAELPVHGARSKAPSNGALPA